MSVTNVLERAGSCSEREMTAHYEYTRAVVQSRSLQYIGPVDQDDITQDAFMRFWLISEKQPISSPKAYIHRIVSTVIVDLARKYRPHLYQGLPVDEDGEVYEGLLLDAAELELHNPETIIEQQEACDELMEKLVSTVAQLHPRQQQAAVCVLKDRVDDLISLVDAFEAHGIDSQVQWPGEKCQRQRLQASYPHAKRNIAQQLEVELALFE